MTSIKDLIKLPVRYESSVGIIYADTEKVAILPTKRPYDGSLSEQGEYIAKVLNEYPGLVQRLEQAEAELAALKESVEPELCDVEGCDGEWACGGTSWRETGYWSLCSKHSQDARDGKPQPKMRDGAIAKEARRGTDGILRD